MKTISIKFLCLITFIFTSYSNIACLEDTNMASSLRFLGEENSDVLTDVNFAIQTALGKEQTAFEKEQTAFEKEQTTLGKEQTALGNKLNYLFKWFPNLDFADCLSGVTNCIAKVIS